MYIWELPLVPPLMPSRRRIAAAILDPRGVQSDVTRGNEPPWSSETARPVEPSMFY
jgi:hypothetical protein